MDRELLTIDISKLKAVEPAMANYCVDDDLMMMEIGGETMDLSQRALNLLKYPLRFDGFFLFFCVTGGFSLEINLKRYDVTPGSLVMILPGSIVRIAGDLQEGFLQGRTVIFAVSSSFTTANNLDFVKIIPGGMGLMNSPFIKLEKEYLEIGKEYLELGHRLMSMPLRYRKEALGALISSITYVAVDLWSEKGSKGAADLSTSRNKILFENFMALVAEHHTRERGMAFYADRLCLSPKYLSKVIKSASGKSGPEWVDAFVIVEAKHLLKYSDATIKEIVYKLNFPNQSVFYKFFKAHTGMTPSEFRRGV